MSSEESYALQSGRQSSDGTLSENAASDGAQTAMTSIMDTDEDIQARDSEFDDDEDLDIISIYPALHYPHASGAHSHTDMHFSPEYSQSASSDVAASTRSLWAQDLDYRDIHGRRYCREYFMPNDEIEQLRLALQHQVFYHVMEGEFTLAPIQDPTHILDVGTGTGEWAIKMAELLPRCEVIGTDIAAIAETRSVPMNVFFEIEDAEDWDRLPDMYDLVHFRCMEGAFQNWRFIYDNAFYSLKPGGWVEVQDFDSAEGFAKFVDSFPPDSPMRSINADLVEAAIKSGRPRGTGHLDPRLFIEAGFVDVRVTEYVIPISVAEKSAGKIWLISCLDALEANCLRLLTEHMGWDPEKCKAACETAARELANIAKSPEKSKGLQVKMRVVIGRKPLDSQPTDLAQLLGRPISPALEYVDDDSPDPTLHPGDEDAMSVVTAPLRETASLGPA
ncbi:S-adenosyl-L-methionine-dependent methyltransferase [Dactylonectria estremocensis]|uniref:S-adenosyl-L-methionine-dependent methyltransferase n=1 Tax=Dactylonectria estremocensis TaxID=1079267 RepID=A0A9P9FE65_9HYPO|nr:S-adenosyl-L-methionine-dependent methyltransferase [Dactylonectria estremocensis]